VNEDVKLRRTVAQAHGLDWRAASFLQGSTVEELEEFAAWLADLLDESRAEPEQIRPPSLFEIAAADKAGRKRTLVNALAAGSRSRARPAGRYTRAATDFSGGARPTAPDEPAARGRAQRDVARLDPLGRKRGRRVPLVPARESSSRSMTSALGRLGRCQRESDLGLHPSADLGDGRCDLRNVAGAQEEVVLSLRQ
jgi:hypothetical protein